MKKDFLNLKNIHYEINSQTILKNINFFIDKGEFISIIGESGSGKTTIGRCLLGLEQMTAGNINFLDKTLGKRQSFRDKELMGKIQLVFQEPAEALNPKMTLFEIVSEPLKNLGSYDTKSEKVVHESFERVGISASDMNKYPNEISMGFQQRVGIARAIVSNPKLIKLVIFSNVCLVL